VGAVGRQKRRYAGCIENRLGLQIARHIQRAGQRQAAIAGQAGIEGGDRCAAWAEIDRAVQLRNGNDAAGNPRIAGTEHQMRRQNAKSRMGGA